VTESLLWRRLLAEFLGSAFLAAAVNGTGIAAQRLSPGDTGVELGENAAATAGWLYVIILMFGPVSGGHFNPVVSLADAVFGGLSWRDATAYLPAQVAGCGRRLYRRAGHRRDPRHRRQGAVSRHHPGYSVAGHCPRDQDHAATSGQADTRVPERERASHG